MGGRSRKGIPRTEDTKKKISNGHIGMKHSKETKLKMSKKKLGNQIQLGLKRTEDTKKLLRESHLGIKQSETTRKKRSISMKEAWRKRKGNLL
jgi:hypothetical protein